MGELSVSGVCIWEYIGRECFTADKTSFFSPNFHCLGFDITSYGLKVNTSLG